MHPHVAAALAHLTDREAAIAGRADLSWITSAIHEARAALRALDTEAHHVPADAVTGILGKVPTFT